MKIKIEKLYLAPTPRFFSSLTGNTYPLTTLL